MQTMIYCPPVVTFGVSFSPMRMPVVPAECAISSVAGTTPEHVAQAVRVSKSSVSCPGLLWYVVPGSVMF